MTFMSGNLKKTFTEIYPFCNGIIKGTKNFPDFQFRNSC